MTIWVFNIQISDAKKCKSKFRAFKVCCVFVKLPY